LTGVPMPATRTLWIVTRKHPPSIGGMEELSYRVARALALKRTVTLVKWGGSQRALVWFVPYALVRVLWALMRRRISVLLIGDPVLGACGALARRFGVPVIATVHGLDITWPNPLYQAYLRRCFFGCCDVYVCISAYVRDLVRARGIPDAAIEVVPVGIAPPPAASKAFSADGDPLLAYVGRLVPRKGIAWFVREVMPKLCEHFPKLVLVAAGEGPEHAAIVAAARHAGVVSHVRLLGAVSEATKWALYRRCDIVVMPNVRVAGDAEGFGLVALEASAIGKPVAAADLEGLRDAVTPGENGWRFAAGNAQAWIDGLSIALRDRAALAALGSRARVYAQRFDWNTIGESYAAIASRIAPA
jgi:phosphatidyl-myo-inositol dimannoside synthase